MKRYSLRIVLPLLFCAVIVMASVTPSSLAYLVARSNTLHNTFRIPYIPPEEPPEELPEEQPPEDISVPVRVQKSMVNFSEQEIGLDGFEFHLIDAETGEFRIMTSDEEGRAALDMTFTAADVGKTYHYRLGEVNTGRENVIYDGTIYDISITLVLSEQREIIAEITIDGSAVTEIAAEFVNKYIVPAPTPDTGDHAQLMLWLVMSVLSGTGLAVLGKKRSVFRRL